MIQSIEQRLQEIDDQIRTLIEDDRLEEAIEHCIQMVDVSIENYGEQSLQYAQAAALLGVCHMENSNFNLAKVHLAKAMDVRRKLLGESDPVYSTSLVYMGRLYACLGMLEEAKETFERAVDIFSQRSEPIYLDYLVFVEEQLDHIVKILADDPSPGTKILTPRQVASEIKTDAYDSGEAYEIMTPEEANRRRSHTDTNR